LSQDISRYFIVDWSLRFRARGMDYINPSLSSIFGVLHGRMHEGLEKPTRSVLHRLLNVPDVSRIHLCKLVGLLRVRQNYVISDRIGGEHWTELYVTLESDYHGWMLTRLRTGAGRERSRADWQE
jgi:hypothetical protein